jgi:predicted lipid-binding transport protein (Tim44 family)
MLDREQLDLGLVVFVSIRTSRHDEEWLTAFAKGERDELRPLLSPDVFATFDAGITARTEPAAAFVKLHDARIVGSALHGRVAEVTVAFMAEFATGSVTDVWTFERNLDSSDPNWLLVATSGELPE